MPRTFRVLVPSARRKKDPSRPGRAKGDSSEACESQGMALDPGIQGRLRKAPGVLVWHVWIFFPGCLPWCGVRR